MGPAALFAGGLAAGLAAGTASCAAVQGGLLVALTGRPRPSARPGSPPPADQVAGHSGSGAGRVAATRADAAAVGAFLSGRLVAHTLLGGLLGLAGSAVRLGASVRAVLLVGAGLMVVFHAVRLILRRRAPACSNDCPDHTDPPGERLGDVERVKDTERGGGHEHGEHAFAPGRGVRAPVRRGLVLGAGTVLVPCGVTISMEVAAVSSGSALTGAAAMAGFALGTAPALAVLGLLLRRLSSSRLAALAGVAALVAGLFTVSYGLRLGGWLPDPGAPGTGLAAAESATDTTARAAPGTVASPGPGGVQRITIWATERGFRPGIVTARAGLPLEIVFRTRDNNGCTRTVTVDGRDVVLTVTGQDVVRLPPRPAGDLRYACGMGMYAGFIRFA
ncbi:sulfite exporter TauE/SafE family protein [Microtetraspora niveoalba]|uniref:sulfite exporter TauE/SafE family protein n=1 Tax=Microtetraspora niveoalba TaxID=46175 RepID=UPI0008367371|nr:sulfite exporter TauE/SafE family protein [Microtetraspora niveoalba]